MTRYSANSSFLRQIRANHERRARQVAHDNDRDRILAARMEKAGVDPRDAHAMDLTARYLFKDTVLRNVAVELVGDRLWIGDPANQGNGTKHQAGFGLQAMEACICAWDGDHLWNPAHPNDHVMISVRDWLEPIERWSWDVRWVGPVPAGQPSFW